MEARSISEDDSSETSLSSGHKPLKPKRRSLVERELETNMTARVTSPLSVIEPGLNTSRYGRARKVKADKEFFDTNKTVSEYLKSHDSELPPIAKKSPANTSSTSTAYPEITPMTKAENFIEKIHTENLSLSRFGSVTKSSPQNQDKTYIRKDLIQRKDIDNPNMMLKNTSKSPYKPSKSSHLKVFLERYSADKSGIEMSESATDGVKSGAIKSSRKRIRKSDTAIIETKKNLDSVRSKNSSSTKKPKRHSINVTNSVVVKTLDFNIKNKKVLLRRQQPEKYLHKRKQNKELPKSEQATKQTECSSKKKNPKSAPITLIEMPDEGKQPEAELACEQPSKKQKGSSSKKRNPKTATVPFINMPEPQGLLIEKTSVVKTLDFDMKKRPNNMKITKSQDNIKVEPNMEKPENQAPMEVIMTQDFFATNGLFEIESLCSYSVGDVAWSRVGTYPFWPCIVTREPFTELFVKKKLFGRVERDVIHVTFFADNGRRGWIVDSMLRQYHGIEEFLAARNGFTVEDKKKDPKLYAAYFISDKKRDTWNQAVNEAEQLFKEPKHIRTDILYEMLSQNKNVKILKKPKTVKIEVTASDLKKPRAVKLDTTDSDVSLSESLYDSLFSDDDSKTVDPVKSRNRTRNKSFDVSDVVTACLDNMAVKTGMAKIQMQSHMDRWLQKAKSQTPEKNQKVLTPNKDRKLSLSLRRNKKTPVKTDTDKPYPLRKFAKESPDNCILNSYQKEHDYTNNDVVNENPSDDHNLNAESSLVSDEVHYIESGTGIGTIMAVESLSDKVSDNQETINDTDMDISSFNEDVSQDNDELPSNSTLDSVTAEIANANELTMEIEQINSKKEKNYPNITYVPTSDTENTSNRYSSGILNNETVQCQINSTRNGITEAMEVEEDVQKKQKNDLETKLLNVDDHNKLLSSEETNKDCEDTSLDNSKDTVLSTVNCEITDQKLLVLDQPNDNLEMTEIKGEITGIIKKSVTRDISSEETNKDCEDTSLDNSKDTVLSTVNCEITDQKLLVLDQPNDNLEMTEIKGEITGIIQKSVTRDTEQYFENIVPVMQAHDSNDKQNIRTDNMVTTNHASSNLTFQTINANEAIIVSNPNIIQNHEGINNNLKNDDLSTEAIVDSKMVNGSETLSEETMDKMKSDTIATRKSLRLNSESPITSQAVHYVNENINIDTELVKSSIIELGLPSNTENKNKSIITNEIKRETGDTRRKSGRLSSFDKLNQTPRVKVTKLNYSHMEIGNIEKSCKVVIECIKGNNVFAIDNKNTVETEPIENTVGAKNVLENGTYENINQSTINNQYAKLNGTSKIDTNAISDLIDCKTVPENKVTKDLMNKDEHNIRKSKRFERKKNSKKPIDWQKEVEDSKQNLLQDIEPNHDYTISSSLEDIEINTAADNIISNERETKARQFFKEINLITSVSEPTDATDYEVKDVNRNNTNGIQDDDVITNNESEKKLSLKKNLNNLSDQRIELDTSLKQTKYNNDKIEIKNYLDVGSNNLQPNYVEINSNAAVPFSTVDVNLNGEEHIEIKSIKNNELQKDSCIPIGSEENTEDNTMKMTDYDNLIITPEKIINADVIFDYGHIDELDSSTDVKLNGISVISTIDAPLSRKRGRPRKSNNLVIDNVVIEEISLTENQINTIHPNDVKVIEDLKPRKRGRPKKFSFPDQNNILTNGYHGDTDSLPEFAHLMDLDVSLDGADFNQAVQVENIALLTDAEVLAKVTEANLSNASMDIDDCQLIPVSFGQTVTIDKQPKEILEKSNELVQNVVDINTQTIEVTETPPDVTLISEQATNFVNIKTKNSKTEIGEKDEQVTTQNQNIECISLSSISIKSESTSTSNVQSEAEEKQSTTDDVVESNEEEIKKKTGDPISDLEEENDEKDQEIQEGIWKRKHRVKPENKLTNDVYKALDDPEFAKYLEMRQDALIDENPHVSQEDVVKYLYKTWIYEQSLKPDAVKSDDLIELNLVKGLGNITASQPKKIKKRVKSQIDKEEKFDLHEVITPRDRSKRRTNPLYLNADDTDIEDEIEIFEIFKNRNKAKKVAATSSTSQTIEEKVIPPEEKTGSELDDIPLANLIADKDEKNIPNDLTEIQADEVIEKPFDQVEYYFEQLTQPKPNVFKGLVRERVCDICFKTSNLVKCRGPCNGMFHIDCVKEESSQISLQNIWSRGRKKKRPRGPRPKNRSQDDSQSEEKDIILEDLFDSSLPIAIDADKFETQLAEKMKELIEKEKVEDLASSDEELKWDDADPGKCEIVNITLKTRRTPSNNLDIDFKCNDCLKLSIPKCYVCKSEKSPKNNMELRQRCQIAQCHKYYHLECLDLWPQTQFNQGVSARKTTDLFDILSCPRHVCHSCVCDDPRGCNTRFSGEKLARCVKCPATYHSFTKCLPAGSQILSASHIICPRHTVNRPGKVPCHVNTGWCFICALGGSLICCEYCPTSFHADCLNIAPPEGNYMCEDCETGRLPLYGEMVWVKLGHYRWWPGLILHPCEIPDNIRCMRHSPGEFVVRFFGQYDHYWVNRGRVFPFQEGDSGRVSSQKSKIDEAFTLAIEHAQRAFQILKTAPPNSDEEAEIALSFLPPQYVRLKVNKPCGSVQVARADDDANGMSQCDCDPRAERPCGANSHCLNRMLLTECGPTCRAVDRCQNRAFEKRLYPKMAPYRTPHRGWGLRTQEDVKAGQFVIEYVGELIDETEFKRRMQLKHEIRDENYYFLTLDKERMIDAGPKGNLARFMNHSCEPNCETQKWTVLGDVRVGLFAIHDIPAFTELTFNYNLECAGIDKKRCMCGAPRCSGYIGAKPKTLEEINPKKKDVYKKRIYKKRRKEDSPSTIKIKIPKPRTTTRSKPKELTEIEKDLLIIKSATNGLLSSDSECSLKLILDEKTNKRKRSFSSEDFLNSDGIEPCGKVLKLDKMLLDAESPSSDGNI